MGLYNGLAWSSVSFYSVGEKVKNIAEGAGISFEQFCILVLGTCNGRKFFCFAHQIILKERHPLSLFHPVRIVRFHTLRIGKTFRAFAIPHRLLK
jgi:hypothetical protein